MRQDESGLEGAKRHRENWIDSKASGLGIEVKGVVGLQMAILAWLPGRWSWHRGTELAWSPRSDPKGRMREVSISRVRGFASSLGNGAGKFKPPPPIIVNPHFKLN